MNEPVEDKLVELAPTPILSREWVQALACSDQNQRQVWLQASAPIPYESLDFIIEQYSTRNLDWVLEMIQAALPYVAFLTAGQLSELFSVVFYEVDKTDYLRFLINYAKEKNLIHLISFNWLNYDDPDHYLFELINLFLANGIVADVHHALHQLLKNDPCDPEGHYFAVLKQLHAIVKNRSEQGLIKISDMQFFFEVAIDSRDFKFAYQLMKRYKLNINRSTGRANNHLARLLHTKLSSRYHLILLVLCLAEQSPVFRAKFGHLSFEPVQTAQQIEAYLTGTLQHFLMPTEPADQDDFNLHTCLQDAASCIRESNTIFQAVPDLVLQKTLLSLWLQYLYSSFPHQLSNMIFLLIEKKSPRITSVKREVVQFICRFVVQHLYHLLSKQNRQVLFHFFENINFDGIYPSLDYWKENIKKIFIFWERLTFTTEHNAGSLDHFLLLLTYSAELNDKALLFRILFTERFKELTDRYQKVGQLIAFLQSRSSMTPNYYTLDKKRKKFLEKNMINLCLKINVIEPAIFMAITNSQQLHYLCLAAKTPYIGLFNQLIKQTPSLSLEEATQILSLAVNTKVRMEIARLILDNVTTRSVESNINQVDFFSSMFEIIKQYRRFYLLPSVLSLVKDHELHLKIAEMLTAHFSETIIMQFAPTFAFRLSSGAIFNSSHFTKQQTEKSWALLSKHVSLRHNYYLLSKFLDSEKSQSIGLTKGDSIFQRELSTKNYQSLIDNLKRPTYLPKGTYDSLMIEKGFDNTGEPNRLAPLEQKAYKTLFHSQWKLTHRIRSSEDLEKIQREGMIASPTLRATTEGPVGTSSPAEFNLAGFIFLTIGPEKSPIPGFLRYTSGIEFDLNQLIKKIPLFLQYMHVCSHWYAFKSQQNYVPINYAGTVVSVSHEDFLQTTEYYGSTLNTRVYTHKKMTDDFFGGKSLISFLCYLFIEKIRLIGGEFYQTVLANADNLEFLSTAFSLIMHPGLLEVRYPYAIPLDETYARIIPPQFKLYPPHEIRQMIDNEEQLKAALEDGLDLDQRLLTTLTINDKTCYYVGNLLTTAILLQNTSVIKFLLSYGTPTFLTEFSGVLNPLDAAIKMQDTETVMTLMRHGIPIRSLPNCYQLCSKSTALEPFLEKQSYQVLYRMVDIGHLWILEKLLISFCRRLSDFSRDSQLIDAIKLLLQRGIDPHAEFNDIDIATEVLELAIDTETHELIPAFVEWGADSQLLFVEAKSTSLVEYLLKIDNPSLISCVVEILISQERLLWPDLFWLFLAGHEAMVRKAIACQFANDFTLPQSHSELVLKMITCLFETRSVGALSLFLTEGTNIQWIKQDLRREVYQTIFDLKHFSRQLSLLYFPYLTQYLLEGLFGKQSLTGYLQTIFQSNLKLKVHFVEYLFNQTGAYSNLEIGTAIEFLKETPHAYSTLINMKTTCNIFNYIDLKFILLLLGLYKKNNTMLRKLYSLMPTWSVHKIVESLFHDTLSVELFILWLAYFVDDDTTTRQLLLQRSVLSAFCEKHLSFLIESLTHYYSGEIAERCRMLLFHFCPSFQLGMVSRSSLEWAKRLNLIHPFEGFGEQRLSVLSFFRKGWSSNRGEPYQPAVIGFLTMMKEGEKYVYLGRKIYQKERGLLIAPGGYARKNSEPLFASLVREIQEETGLRIDLPFSVEKVDKKLLNKGTIKLPNATDCPNTPDTITFIHYYREFDPFNSRLQLRERSLFFFWLDFSHNLQALLSSGDDFTEGQWFPLSQIQNNPEGFSVNDQRIAKSNGLLIQLINDQPVSKRLIDEAIFSEKFSINHYNRARSTFFTSVVKGGPEIPSTQTAGAYQTSAIKSPDVNAFEF
jgi:8-oxo-dGTP pyrophosphatase MutT (NUDIX family)